MLGTLPLEEELQQISLLQAGFSIAAGVDAATFRTNLDEILRSPEGKPKCDTYKNSLRLQEAMMNLDSADLLSLIGGKETTTSSSNSDESSSSSSESDSADSETETLTESEDDMAKNLLLNLQLNGKLRWETDDPPLKVTAMAEVEPEVEPVPPPPVVKEVVERIIEKEVLVEVEKEVFVEKDLSINELQYRLNQAVGEKLSRDNQDSAEYQQLMRDKRKLDKQAAQANHESSLFKAEDLLNQTRLNADMERKAQELNDYKNNQLYALLMGERTLDAAMNERRRLDEESLLYHDILLTNQPVSVKQVHVQSSIGKLLP